MGVRLMVACCLLGMGTAVATAPMSAAQGSESASMVTPAVALNAELNLIEGEMMGAVKAMPADKYDFAPSASIFVPGQKTEFATVRTFAQQATHVAQANYSLFSAMSGLKPDVDTKALGTLTKKDDIVAALAASFAFGHKAIATLAVANAFEVVKGPEPGLQTRSTLAGFVVSHAFDHYGQMVEYLRMNGIVPPASAR